MFDTHCHLQDKRIIASLDDVITAASAAGVCRLLCCSAEVSDWQTVADIGKKYCGAVTCAFGVHPWHAGEISDGFEAALEKYLAADPAAAVGEIGLDTSVTPRNDDMQADLFVRQLKVAERFKRPVSIHCRKAWGKLLSALKDAGGLKYGGAIHSYSGAPDLVGELERLGCYISFSGAVLNSRNRRAAESLKRVSPDRLLIETDSPDMLPTGAAPPNNVPSNLFMIRNKIAEILGLSLVDVGKLTYENGLRLFRF